jgi:adenine-specific DNA-methyltransferase
MTRPLEKFQQLLRELFQFEDAAELDFGIYRIMKLRRERMEQWLTVDLPARAKEIIKGSSASFDDDLAQRLEGLRTQLQAVQHDAIDADGNLVALETSDAGKEYAKLRGQQRRAPLRSTADIEILVYNNLCDFFSRYYDAGDFMAKRRWSFAPDGRDTYAVPWNGEEVVLHWANKDQYYIKTGERFTHYRWESVIGERTFKIEFQLTNADLPANNNKDPKKKFYLPVLDKIVWDEVTATLIVPFHWRGLFPQDQIEAKQEEKIRQNVNDATRERLVVHAAVTAVPHLVTALMAPKKDAAGNTIRDKDNNPVPLLRYHLNRWTRKNESDFFIHRDLRRFLAGELDYFLKSVVLNLDNLLAAGELRAEPNFRLLEAVKKLGTEIIDFLAQLENFQKALFEKKKFIVETSWCLTLDRIPGAVKEEVFDAILVNDRQWEAWEKLNKLSSLPTDLITPQLRTHEFLEAFPYLMLDTALGYEHALVEKLIGGIENLDERTDGLIIHSENLQALNLLQERYRESIAFTHIDPPYNTETSGFNYKNNYQHSSWLTMMQIAVSFGWRLLCKDGAFACHIDENEYEVLHKLCGELGIPVAGTIVWDKKNPMLGGQGIATQHEYILWLTANGSVYLRPKNVETILAKAQEIVEKHDGVNEKSRREFAAWIRKQNEFSGGERAYNQLNDDGRVYQSVSMEAPEPRTDPKFFVPLIHPLTKKPCPIPKNGWSRAPETINQLIARDEVIFGRDESIQPRRKIFLTAETRRQLSSVISDSSRGKNDLDKLGLVFPYCHPLSLYIELNGAGMAGTDDIGLDHFAGSGTTGHAIIALNREDGGSRKSILVEMGQHFDTVLKPRLLKVVFSENWKDGKPFRKAKPKDAANPYDGISHCLKVLRLESYEDALDNIDFDTDAAPGDELPIEFRRDYELRYALDWESRECPTRLAVEKLEIPFEYTLTLRRESGTETVTPDVPETFAYLIGLHTRRRFWTKRDNHDYLIYTGTLHADGTETAVVWRTCRDWNEDEFQKEKDWWREEREALAPGASRLYVNAACAIEGHLCLDLEFNKRMHPSYATV